MTSLSICALKQDVFYSVADPRNNFLSERVTFRSSNKINDPVTINTSYVNVRISDSTRRDLAMNKCIGNQNTISIKF